MRLSTSTNILDEIPGRPNASVEECLRRCSACGFKVFDMNFCDQSNDYGYFHKDNWEAETHRIKALADSLGVEFSQSHLEFYNVLDPSVPNREWREEMVRRGIIASGILGAKWAVLHLGSLYEGHSYAYARSMEGNMEYLKPHLALAAEHGVGLAVENLPDKEFRRYSGSVSELIDLVDRMDAPNLGICWDFGHAELMHVDQAYWLKRVGKRLKAVHVQDNHGKADDHVAPFYGIIDWEPQMKTLKEIGYAYDLTYEIHNMTNHLPDALRESQLRHLYDIGMTLLSYAE